MIGAPPGYVGYEEGGQLTEAVRRRPYSVVLFDEIEKAHPEVFNVFLQIMDDGRLTDGKGRVVDFKNTIIIMTSNIGSGYLQDLTSPERLSEAHNEVMEALRAHFKPEFLNRVDDIIIFNPLGKEQLAKIVDLRLEDLRKLLADRKISLELTPAAKEMVFTEGYDPNYGARPLKRAIQRADSGSAGAEDSRRRGAARRSRRGGRRQEAAQADVQGGEARWRAGGGGEVNVDSVSLIRKPRMSGYPAWCPRFAHVGLTWAPASPLFPNEANTALPGSLHRLQLFYAEVSVAKDVSQNFGMKDFSSVERNRNPLSSRVLVDHVTAALSGERESSLLECRDDLAGGQARQLGHQTATSTMDRLTETCSGTSSPSAKRSSMCSRMASLMFSTASS